MTLLRPIEARDHDRVLDLNARNVALLAPLDDARLLELLGWADRGDVVEHDGRVVGFVLTFAPGTPYDSENYRWFTRAFDDFYYLDRIVLDDDVRRLGLGRRVYDELEEVARRHGRMVLEVNLEPPNEPSLAFHRTRGYADLAALGAVGKKVLLMEKPLRALTHGGSP